MVKAWLLCFDVSKCKVLHIDNTPYAGDYRLGHVYLALLARYNMHDLGILMDSKLKFRTHHESCMHALMDKQMYWIAIICAVLVSYARSQKVSYNFIHMHVSNSCIIRSEHFAS